ncbi:MAG TPA: tryptophan synthase subunit alpha [Ferruginibacter sp.]|nr:tryptophan synthase subunit alpha [Ferruginibacter sp.]
MTEYNDNLHNNSKGFAFENARSLRKTQTKAEQILWEALRNDQVCKLKFRRQHPFGNYILDFYNHKMKLVIEVDGEIHNDPEVEAYDKIRTQNLNENGLTVLRFSNSEVEKNLKEVINKIEDWFEENDFVELEPWPDEIEDPTAKMNKGILESTESNAPLSSRRGAGGEVNRLTQLFTQKKTGVLNMYCTAGYPQLNSTVEVITALQDHGADIIELGIPYSDPIADGPVIQKSNMQALQNGMSIPVLFEQLKNIRQHIRLPIILMGYMNPVLQYGIEKFCEDAASVGVDGIILPDLPMYEFETAYRQFFKKHDLKFIFLVTPQTSEERIRQIDALSSGFIYAVSSSSTTGNTKPIEDQYDYFKKLKDLNLANPILVGFGIKDKKTFEAACRYSNGGIIGSAYINALKNTTDIGLGTKDFINTLKD